MPWWTPVVLSTANRQVITAGNAPKKVRHGQETRKGAVAAGLDAVFHGLFDRACLQPRLQAAARRAQPHLSAVPGDVGAVGGGRPLGQGDRRAAASRLGNADAAAQATGND